MGNCCCFKPDATERHQKLCEVLLQELRSAQPFKTVRKDLKKQIINQLGEYIQMVQHQDGILEHKPNKIITDIKPENKSFGKEEQEWREENIKAYFNKQFEERNRYATSHSSRKRSSQKQRISQQSQQLRSSGQRSSGITNMQFLTNRTYSFPRLVMELNENEREIMMIEMGEIKEKNSEYYDSLLQMIKITQSRVLQQDKIIQQKDFENKKLKQAISQLEMQNRLIRQLLQTNKLSIQSLSTEINILRAFKLTQDKLIQEFQKQKQKLNLSKKQDIMEAQKFQKELSQQKIKEINQENQKQSREELQKQSRSTQQSSFHVKDDFYLTILKYFRCSELLPNLEDKYNALEFRHQIISMFTKNICSTKLIYKYDSLSQLHFNKYIQRKHNLLVLIQLQNDTYVGGFVGEIDQNQEVQDTFLFSLRLKRDPIHLVPKGKVKRIDYESGFLNFGNGQIKIKARSTSFSCNVSGLCVKYFNGEKKVSIETFLGDQERSCNIKGYQIYQIFFKKDRQ